METIRRTELLIFIITMIDKLGLPRPKLVQSTGIKIQKDKSSTQVVDFDPKKEDMSSKNKNLLTSLISNNFINASMQGYLEKKSEGWFGGWTEKYCVLTNVGLLYYDDP